MNETQTNPDLNPDPNLNPESVSSDTPTFTPQEDGPAREASPEPSLAQSAANQSTTEEVLGAQRTDQSTMGDRQSAIVNPQSEIENPQSEIENVPMARFQGVQRLLSATEAALQTANATIETLNAQVAEANRTAATARIAEIRATHADIVPDLLTGSTLTEVETSLQNSRRAFAAAQQAYARTIPVPAGNPAAAVPNDQPSLSPLQMISAGLRQPKSDINR